MTTKQKSRQRTKQKEKKFFEGGEGFQPLFKFIGKEKGTGYEKRADRRRNH